MTKKDDIINNLTKQIVELTTGIAVGDLVVHKTDLDVTTPYVVTDVIYNEEDDQAYCQCANHKGLHQDALAFKLVELSKLNAEE
jgi:hypothetical protein